jgi:serine/arginine repetitive matrix protein 1
MKFPPEFEKKVAIQSSFVALTLKKKWLGCQIDTRKINLSVIRPWIAKKVVELVGFEDEVVVEYAMGLLEDRSQPVRLSPRFTGLG